MVKFLFDKERFSIYIVFVVREKRLNNKKERGDDRG